MGSTVSPNGMTDQSYWWTFRDFLDKTRSAGSRRTNDDMEVGSGNIKDCKFDFSKIWQYLQDSYNTQDDQRVFKTSIDLVRTVIHRCRQQICCIHISNRRISMTLWLESNIWDKRYYGRFQGRCSRISYCKPHFRKKEERTLFGWPCAVCVWVLNEPLREINYS